MPFSGTASSTGSDVRETGVTHTVAPLPSQATPFLTTVLGPRRDSLEPEPKEET
jgi:hypothetical protein